MDFIDTAAVNTARTGPRNGTTVVFVHAMAMDLTFWDRQFDGLGDSFDLIAFDLPSHGLPRKPRSRELSFDSAAAMVDVVTRAADVDGIHLVGLSLGGQVALNYALRCPENVHSLHFSTQRLRCHPSPKG